MSSQEKRFCEQLAETFSDVKSILNEHLANCDELLPHVFMGDVTRYVLEDGIRRADVVQRLEDALTGTSGGIEELIAVSFIENIETLDDLNLALTGVRGNSLRQEWQSQHEG